MKKLLCLFLFSCLLCVGASAPTVTSTLVFIGTNPQFDASGACTALPVEAAFTNSVTVGTETFTSQSRANWDAVKTATHAISYTWDGKQKTITRGELAAALLADATAMNPQ